MPSANGPGVGKHRDVWTIVCHYLRHPQPADLQAVLVTCSSISGVARAIMCRSLIVGPHSFLVALSVVKGLDRGIPASSTAVRLYSSPQYVVPGKVRQMIQSRLTSCLRHLPLLSILSLECRHIILLMLEAISQLANIRPTAFTFLRAAFTQPPMPNGTLKFSGPSFMKNFKAWSS